MQQLFYSAPFDPKTFAHFDVNAGIIARAALKIQDGERAIVKILTDSLEYKREDFYASLSICDINRTIIGNAQRILAEAGYSQTEINAILNCLDK